MCPGAALRYPSWGRIRTRINVARSNYQGFVASVNKRFSSGWQTQVSYTLGNSKDTWSGGQIGGSDFDNGAGSATDWWDPEYEYGPSSYDVRHNLVINGVYQLPIATNVDRRKGAVAQGLAGRWRGAVLERPALHTAPQLRPGRRSAERRGGSEAEHQRRGRPTARRRTSGSIRRCSPEPAAGVFGNATRNSLRAPGIKIADLSVFKNLVFGRYQGQFRLEAFNAFNVVNLGIPDFNIFSSAGLRNATAGRIRTTSTPARQIQLGFKFMF